MCVEPASFWKAAERNKTDRNPCGIETEMPQELRHKTPMQKGR
jgi:hypothetical protein